MTPVHSYVLILFGTLISAWAAQAEGFPSAKATARVGDIGILRSTQRDWSTLMSSRIKTANQKDLFVSAALECGLLTQTQVKGKAGSTDSSTANASVQVRVLVDGKPAAPGEVTFCRRTQELTATFGGVLESCTDLNGDGTIFAADECTFTDEQINLLIDTMNANSFNFVLPDVSSGVHTIEVQAKIDSGTTSSAGSASAAASIGRGSVLIEEVRMIQNDPVEF